MRACLRPPACMRQSLVLAHLPPVHAQVRRDQERQLAQALEALQSGLVETSKALSQDVVEPAVCTALGEIYLAAANERGPGSFARVRAAGGPGLRHA